MKSTSFRKKAEKFFAIEVAHAMEAFSDDKRLLPGWLLDLLKQDRVRIDIYRYGNCIQFEKPKGAGDSAVMGNVLIYDVEKDAISSLSIQAFEATYE